MPISETATVPLAPLRKRDYGIDAPAVVRRFFVIGNICLAASVILIAARALLPFWSRYLIPPCVIMGCVFVSQGAVMVWGSKFGKLRLRDPVLDGIAWRGDEQVLDVGCGHGLMLIGAAKRLRTGKAVGIDLWQKEDQAGNSRRATEANALAEGVADRIELHDGDARKLPFPDESFDVVLSSWALHNIYDASGREQAVQEIVRVVKPRGRVVIIDIRHTADYAETLKQAGMLDVQRCGPNFMFIIPTYVITALKG